MAFVVDTTRFIVSHGVGAYRIRPPRTATKTSEYAAARGVGAYTPACHEHRRTRRRTRCNEWHGSGDDAPLGPPLPYQRPKTSSCAHRSRRRLRALELDVSHCGHIAGAGSEWRWPAIAHRHEIVYTLAHRQTGDRHSGSCHPVFVQRKAVNHRSSMSQPKPFGSITVAPQTSCQPRPEGFYVGITPYARLSRVTLTLLRFE